MNPPSDTFETCTQRRVLIISVPQEVHYVNAQGSQLREDILRRRSNCALHPVEDSRNAAALLRRTSSWTTQ
jgi:hypothetical protein